MKKALAIVLSITLLLISAVSLVACIDTEDEQPTKYRVTFDSNGGTAVASQEVESGKTVTKPTDPTKENYNFGGWALNGIDYVFSNPVTADITLTAKWVLEDDIASMITLATYYTTRNSDMNATGDKAYTNDDLKYMYAGDDNVFLLPVDARNVDFELITLKAEDYNVVLKENGTTASFDTYATKVDNGIQFKAAAVDKVFDIEVSLVNAVGSVTIQDVKVVDAYNVYTVEDLNKVTFNTFSYAGENYGNPEVLRRIEIETNGVVLQRSITITQADLSEHMYETAKESDQDKPLFDEIGGKALKDEVGLFGFKVAAGQEYTLNGNFYSLSYQDIPPVIRDAGTIRETTELDGKVVPVGHIPVNSTFITVSARTEADQTGTQFNAININIIGNSGVADGDTIMIKTGGLKGISVYGGGTTDNQNTKALFDNFHSMFPKEAVLLSWTDGTFVNSRTENIGESGFYLWHSLLKFDNSVIKGTGGPAFCLATDYAGQKDLSVARHYSAVDVTETSTVEAKLTGAEPWFDFNMPGMGVMIVNMLNLGVQNKDIFPGLNVYRKTITKAENGKDYFNWISVSVADGAFKSDTNNLELLYTKTNISHVLEDNSVYTEAFTFNPMLVDASVNPLRMVANPLPTEYGLMVPDGSGGYVPATNCKYFSIGLFGQQYIGLYAYVALTLEMYDYTPAA